MPAARSLTTTSKQPWNSDDYFPLTSALSSLCDVSGVCDTEITFHSSYWLNTSSQDFDKVNEENKDKFPETNDDIEVVLEPLDTTLLDQYISHGI